MFSFKTTHDLRSFAAHDSPGPGKRLHHWLQHPFELVCYTWLNKTSREACYSISGCSRVFFSMHLDLDTRTPNNVERTRQTPSTSFIRDNKTNVEWLLNRSLNAFIHSCYSFNFDSTCFNEGWKGGANSFNIAIQQNRRDVEANCVDAVCLVCYGSQKILRKVSKDTQKWPNTTIYHLCSQEELSRFLTYERRLYSPFFSQHANCFNLSSCTWYSSGSPTCKASEFSTTTRLFDVPHPLHIIKIKWTTTRRVFPRTCKKLKNP